MREAVCAMLDRYPAATLQDVYKSMFQDRFGVAHMVESRDAVVTYIERELEACEGAIAEYHEPCGWRGDFIRVDLRAIRDGVLTAEELADMFIQSECYAPVADSIALRNWAEEWSTIIRVCHSRLRAIDGFERDSTLLAELIARGKYVVHHSRRYNDNYHPHYRIVHKSQVAR